LALVVITGGARSGKSGAAERLAVHRALDGAAVTVVVFGRGHAEDPEFEDRIARHQADRPESFATVEAADSLSWRDATPDDSVLMLDCLGTLLGRVMEEQWEPLGEDTLLDAPADALPGGYDQAVTSAFDEAVDWLSARAADTIVVTNEVGDGIVPTHATGRLFRDVLGRANRVLCDRADAAYLVVAGRLVSLSDLPRDAAWPQD
jgi:adenosylcobinamide kinase/adenosylcobinamide-phosphate guanylyltransferase